MWQLSKISICATCVFCPPVSLVTVFKWSSTFFDTFPNIFSSMFLMAVGIVRFNNVKLFHVFLKTLPFVYYHRKSSNGVRSGDIWSPLKDSPLPTHAFLSSRSVIAWISNHNVEELHLAGTKQCWVALEAMVNTIGQRMQVDESFHFWGVEVIRAYHLIYCHSTP